MMWLKSPRLYWLMRIGWVERIIFRMVRFVTFRFSRKVPKVLDVSLFGFDFSYYQGVIDFAKVFLYGTKFLILRAGYGLMKDKLFDDYMLAARDLFLGKLSVYHYYYPHLDPVEQANRLIETLKPYRMYIRRVWGDFEFVGTGAYQSSENWKRYASTIVSAGYKFGVYTRATWWDSRVGALVSYFSQFPIWAAQYAPALTLIPKGWTKADTWQTGTPVLGEQVGTQSLEVDYDICDTEFYVAEYGGLPEPPPQTGETMKTGKVIYSGGINLRNAPGVITTASDIGDLMAGDVLESDRDQVVGTTVWWHLTSAKRNGVDVKTTDGRTVAQRTDCWASTGNGTYIQETTPAGQDVFELYRNGVLEMRIEGTITVGG